MERLKNSIFIRVLSMLLSVLIITGMMGISNIIVNAESSDDNSDNTVNTEETEVPDDTQAEKITLEFSKSNSPNMQETTLFINETDKDSNTLTFTLDNNLDELKEVGVESIVYVLEGSNDFVAVSNNNNPKSYTLSKSVNDRDANSFDYNFTTPGKYTLTVFLEGNSENYTYEPLTSSVIYVYKEYLSLKETDVTVKPNSESADYNLSSNLSFYSDEVIDKINIEYAIQAIDEDGKSIDDSIAEVKDAGETITLKKTGRLKVTVTVKQNKENFIAEQLLEYTINIVKGEQSLEFTDTDMNIIYGTTQKVSVKADGGNSETNYSYSSVNSKQNPIEKLDSDSNGEYYLKLRDGVYNGEATVTAEKKGNDLLENAQANFSLTVSPLTLDSAAADYYSIEGEKGKDGWYTSDVTVTPKEGYLISTSNSYNTDNWKSQIKLTNNGVYDGKNSLCSNIIYLRDINEDSETYNGITAPITILDGDENLKIDKNAPTIDRVSYTSEEFGGSFDLSEDSELSTGKAIIMNIYANDGESGVDYIMYKLTNKEDDQYEDNWEILDCNEDVGNLEIDEQWFNGWIYIKAYDSAGNYSDISKYRLVMNQYVPSISVRYTNSRKEDAEKNYYYNGRALYLTIEDRSLMYTDIELNTPNIEADLSRISDDDLYVIIGTPQGEEVKIPASKLNLEVVSFSADKTVVQGEILFGNIDGCVSEELKDDGEYVIKKIYCGNKYNNYTEYLKENKSDNIVVDESDRVDWNDFCIDNVSPEINVDIDGDNLVEYCLDDITDDSEIEYYPGFCGKNIKLTLSGSDELSGIKCVMYSYDNVNWENLKSIRYSAINTKGGEVNDIPLSIEENKSTAVYLRVVDRAGNIADYKKDGETIEGIWIVNDSKSPEIEVLADGTPTNDKYFKEERHFQITITDENLLKEVSNTKISPVIEVYGCNDTDGDYFKIEKDGEKINKDELIKLMSDLKYWNTIDQKSYTFDLYFTGDAGYTFEITCSDASGNSTSASEKSSTNVTLKGSSAYYDFFVDNTNPRFDAVTLSSSDGNIVDDFNESDEYSHKFYGKSIEIEIIANDDCAGIDYIELEYNNKTCKIVNTTEKNDFTKTIKVTENWSGIVYIRAYDKTGRRIDYVAGDQAADIYGIYVVTDSISPQITISADGTPQNDMYFSSQRKFTVKVEELNAIVTNNSNKSDDEKNNNCTAIDLEMKVCGYDESKVNKIFTLTKDGSGISVKELELEMEDLSKWEKDENGIYSFSFYVVEDGQYSFDLTFTDIVGNSTTTKKESEFLKVENNAVYRSFIIDKTNPKITWSFDNNDAKNSKYFSDERTATIAVTDRNINLDDVSVTIGIGNDTTSVPLLSMWKYENEKFVDAGSIKLTNIGGNNEVSLEANCWYSDNENNTYIFKLTFNGDASYRDICIKSTDLAGNTTSSNNSNDFTVGKGTLAWNEFVIDKTNPTSEIKVVYRDTDGSSLGENTYSTLKAESENKPEYNRWFNKSVDVSISSSDNLSGIMYVDYLKTDSTYNLNRESLEKIFNNESGIIRKTDSGVVSFTVSPDEKFVVYAKVTDMSGNVSYTVSNGYTLDKTLPDIEKVEPEVTITPVTQPVNGIYNTDIKIDVEVEDPATGSGGVYSGLEYISYRVINDGIETQSGVLLDLTASMDIQQKWSKSAAIIVDSTANNSNNVIVEVYARDRSQNEAVKESSMKIDIKNPKIEVSYDNNNADDSFSGYFNSDRTATIVVTERNFDEENTVITVTNTETGAKIASGNWRVTQGDGNGDNDKYTSEITISNDGKYTFEVIKVTDLAGNNYDGNIDYGDSVTPTAFVIDKTSPTISVKYDNNSAKNGNYYKTSRKATITIYEHNFDSSRVSIDIKATQDGKDVDLPKMSSWVSSGDVNTLIVDYSSDALYTFGISYTDMAGNSADQFSQQQFYIDKTAPQISIEGVENNSANNGDVIPIVSYSDTNFDADSVSITLKGANRGNVKLDGSASESSDGGSFTFNNFAKLKIVDDIYELTATVTDKAGNSATKKIEFSVNRFGSTYNLDGANSINGKYVNSTGDVVVVEMNVTKLTYHKVTLMKNMDIQVLTLDRDYTFVEEGDDKNGYKYTYTVFEKNFEDDAKYSLIFHSEDAASNTSENTLDTKAASLSFNVDKTAPEIMFLSDFVSGETYAVNEKSVVFKVTDNRKIASITLDVDGEITEWDEASINENENGQYEFTIYGDKTTPHTVKVTCLDAAGNETVAEISDIYVTTDVLVRYTNDKKLVFGSVGVAVSCIAVIILIAVIVIKKKKRT